MSNRKKQGIFGIKHQQASALILALERADPKKAKPLWQKQLELWKQKYISSQKESAPAANKEQTNAEKKDSTKTST